MTRTLPHTSSSRCTPSDSLCARAHVQEPWLPVLPPFGESAQTGVNPCMRLEMDGNGGKTVLDSCFPGAHLLPAWHSFAHEALDNLFRAHPQVRMASNSLCFGHWVGDQGAARWARTFGAPRRGTLLLQSCESLLQWYPAFAARYLKTWNAFYDKCKGDELARLHGIGKDERDYFGEGGAMWRSCRPGALAAHDKATGTGGPGAELTPPFVMRNAYGATHGRLLIVLRNPVERLETSFWVHVHYPKRYGASADGLHSYVVEQSAAFDGCVRKHGARRCAFLFEYLDPLYSDVFFHCDQLIRGVYEPFVRDWVGAFGNRTLVARAEDLLDEPQRAQKRVLRFLGLPVPARGLPAPDVEYAPLHALSLKGGRFTAQPMHNATRHRLRTFYAPHNERLAQLLDDPRFLWHSE